MVNRSRSGDESPSRLHRRNGLSSMGGGQRWDAVIEVGKDGCANEARVRTRMMDPLAKADLIGKISYHR